MSQTVRGWAVLAAKVALSVGVFAFAASRIDMKALTEAAAGLKIAPLAAALFVLVLTVFAASWRWSFLARGPAPLSFQSASKITFAALFLGQVLPTSLGQDAVRALLARRAEHRLTDTVSVIFLDRICGFLGLSVLILLMLPWLVEIAGGARSHDAAFAAIALAVCALLGGAILRFAPAPEQGPRIVLQAIEAARRAGVMMTSAPGLVAVTISVGVQVLAVLCIWLIARSIDAPLSLTESFATVPAALFVALLPISINGWGVREGAMVVSLGFAGVSPTDAFLISVLFGVALLATSLPGAAALATFGRDRWTLLSPKTNR